MAVRRAHPEGVKPSLGEAMSSLFDGDASHNVLGNPSTHVAPEGRPQFSIVVPAYNEEGNLWHLYEALDRVLEGVRWEVIFVDDGSSDSTWDTIVALRHADDRVKGIRLSRNFGHQYALFAGLARAEGEAVICMDADLQHPPRVIPTLIDQWHKGMKVVHTLRIDPEDFSLFKRLTARVYYKLFSFLSGVELKQGMADFRLLDRQVVNNIIQFPEQGLFLRGLVQWVGYPSSEVQYRSEKRRIGTSKYTFWKMVQFAWNGIASFSLVPLRLGIAIGIVTSAGAFAELVYVIYARYFLPGVVPGWASALGWVSLLFGILFILIGILGEYIGRILIEARGRPRFLVEEEIGLHRVPAKAQEGSVIWREHAKS